MERSKHLNLSNFFPDHNWSIHPEWVYCRYHYPGDHDFNTAEEELLHFLKIISNNSNKQGQRLTDQYTKYDESDSADAKCFYDENYQGDPKYISDYYCDRELIDLLIFDAKASNDSFFGEFIIDSPQDKTLADQYKVFLRFIATPSGLTRWQLIPGVKFSELAEKVQEFSKSNKAVEELWYKEAIFQHEYDSENIVLTGRIYIHIFLNI